AADASFGKSGSVPIDGNRASLMVQPDGRIIVAYAGKTSALTRFLPDGGVDKSFGTNGRVEGIGGSTAILDRSGRVVVIRSEGSFEGAGGTVERFTSAGKLDKSFGHNGVLALPERFEANSLA